jgi:hypothetical protein
MLNVTMLNIIVLSVAIQNVTILSVMAPLIEKHTPNHGWCKAIRRIASQITYSQWTLNGGARYVTGENLEQVFNFKLGSFASQERKRMAHMLLLLELKTRPRFPPCQLKFVRDIKYSCCLAAQNIKTSFKMLKAFDNQCGLPFVWSNAFRLVKLFLKNEKFWWIKINFLFLSALLFLIFMQLSVL